MPEYANMNADAARDALATLAARVRRLEDLTGEMVAHIDATNTHAFNAWLRNWRDTARAALKESK